jgi:hypothetical protein
MLRGQRATRCLLDAGLLLAAMLLAGAASVLLLRQDSNGDLQNYHFYNGWAFVHGRLGWDLAPAQLQTFHNPLLDLPFYWMVATDWPPRLISFAMALPAGVGASMPRRWLPTAAAITADPFSGLDAAGYLTQSASFGLRWPMGVHTGGDAV